LLHSQSLFAHCIRLSGKRVGVRLRTRWDVPLLGMAKVCWLLVTNWLAVWG
jgi:hypothetical protein